MAQTDEQKIADVRREENIVRRVLLDMVWQVGVGRMLGDVAVPFIGTVAKLCVNRREDLLRRRWPWGHGQTVAGVAVGFVEHRVFRGGRDRR